MTSLHKKCFVCNSTLSDEEPKINSKVNLPVCSSCDGTLKEKERVVVLLEGLADGFVCGCI